MAAPAYPTNRARSARKASRPGDSRSRPKPANDNRRPVPKPANDNRPGVPRSDLPRSPQSFPRVPSMALRLAVAAEAVNIGSLIIGTALDWAIAQGRLQSWRVPANWTLRYDCATENGGSLWQASAGTICGSISGATNTYTSPEALLAANPTAQAMGFYRPFLFNGNPRLQYDIGYARVSGQPALPAPYYDLGMVNVPAAEPLVPGRTMPLWVPAVDPMALPVGVPQPHPVPVPFPLIPVLPRVDPNRSPDESPVRGPRPRPRPRPRPNPRPNPGAKPGEYPKPEVVPELPRNLPSTDVIVEPGKKPLVVPNSQHSQRPPGRGEKEKKSKRYAQGLALISGTLGVATEGAEIIDAIYKSIPAKLRRWKGRDGKWRERAITPQGKLLFVYQHMNDVDMDKATLNLLQNEYQDRQIGAQNSAPKGHTNQEKPLGTGLLGFSF